MESIINRPTATTILVLPILWIVYLRLLAAREIVVREVAVREGLPDFWPDFWFSTHHACA